MVKHNVERAGCLALHEQACIFAEIEVYSGSKHGRCPPDSAVFDEATADKTWARMLALDETDLA